jgi:hypothetical protein
MRIGPAIQQRRSAFGIWPKQPNASGCGEGTRPFISATGSSNPLPVLPLRIEAEFLENPILPFGVLDRPLSRFGAAEDRYLAIAVIIEPLNPPLPSVHPVLEDLGWRDVGLAHGIVSSGIGATARHYATRRC